MSIFDHEDLAAQPYREFVHEGMIGLAALAFMFLGFRYKELRLLGVVGVLMAGMSAFGVGNTISRYGLDS